MSLSREQWATEWQRLREVDWRDLDVKEAGRWPLLLKALSGCLALLVALSVMLWFVVSEQREALMAAQREEVRLLSEYRSKASEAAFLPEMREQLATLEGQMARLRRMLPTDAEIPSLLDSISDAAVDNRLSIETIRLRPTLTQTHYVEQPLDIIAGKRVMLATEMTINGHQPGFIKDAVELFFSEGKQCLRDTLF